MQTKSQPTPEEIIDWLTSISTPPKAPTAPQPTFVRSRHPLTYVTPWLLMANLACMLLISSSMIEAWVLEQLVYLGIMFSLFALISLLVRERDQVSVFQISFDRSQDGKTPGRFSWADLQRRNGVTPVVREPEKVAA